jgi:hypothetical protein
VEKGGWVEKGGGWVEKGGGGGQVRGGGRQGQEGEGAGQRGAAARRAEQGSRGAWVAGEGRPAPRAGGRHQPGRCAKPAAAAQLPGVAGASAPARPPGGISRPGGNSGTPSITPWLGRPRGSSAPPERVRPRPRPGASLGEGVVRPPGGPSHLRAGVGRGAQRAGDWSVAHRLWAGGARARARGCGQAPNVRARGGPAAVHSLACPRPRWAARPQAPPAGPLDVVHGAAEHAGVQAQHGPAPALVALRHVALRLVVLGPGLRLPLLACPPLLPRRRRRVKVHEGARGQLARVAVGAGHGRRGGHGRGAGQHRRGGGRGLAVVGRVAGEHEGLAAAGRGAAQCLRVGRGRAGGGEGRLAGCNQS